MKDKMGSSLPTKKLYVTIPPNFKKFYGESFKDSWVRINKINGKNTNACEKEKLHLYFYYGLVPWYKNALDFSSGGSFMLVSLEQNSTVIKNLFGRR
jgi:hypothetical protein